MKNRLFSLAAVLLIVLSACSPAINPDYPEVARPDNGKCTFVGRVIDTYTEKPLDTIVRLAEVIRQEGTPGAYVLDEATSPGSFTDAQGFFAIENVTVMEWVVIVGYTDVYRGYEVIATEERKPRVYTCEAGEIVDLGNLAVSIEK